MRKSATYLITRLFPVFCLLLAACSASAPALTATPTPAPTTQAEPTPAGPARPLLPAPLYVLDRGQIARIERDGVTRAQLTRERIAVQGFPPIATFDLSPSAGLAYVVGDSDADRLVRTGLRGENPQIIYSQPGHELSDLAWTPDGAFLYLRLLNNNTPPDIPGGIYRIPAAGGALEPIRADDPVDDPVNPARTISGYRPVAWSPDGTKLLIEIFSLFYEGCSLGVIAAEGGEPARISTPEGIETYCGEAAWSPDSSTILLLAGPPLAEGGPSVWRAAATGGQAEPLSGPDALARAPFAAPGGQARFFLVQIEGADATGNLFSYTPVELTGPAATPDPLGEPFPDRLALALWAPDGSGAALVVEPAADPLALRWAPAGPGPSVDLPNTREGIRALRWGSE